VNNNKVMNKKFISVPKQWLVQRRRNGSTTWRRNFSMSAWCPQHLKYI